jgi:diphosphomevalonate decarboxylase
MTTQCASASAHPNVALIKYWGKRDAGQNIPAVGSLSITLGAMQTHTTLCFDDALGEDRLVLDGQPATGEHDRLRACLDALRGLAGDKRCARIESANDFPTAAGLASSASGYAALAVAGAAALGMDPGDARLVDVARIGSGSAPRSLFGGFALLRVSGEQTQCEQLLAAEDWPLEVVVAVTRESGKSVTSRDGMRTSRLTSDYYPAWVDSHAADLDAAVGAVDDRDFEKLADLSEVSCLKMHAVMMSTRPPLLYWSPATLACIHEIRAMRSEGLGVFFTIDAGPQVKAVCLPGVRDAVCARLEAVPGVLRLIPGGLGGPPVVARVDA